MSGNMKSYYERARDSDLLARGDLLLFRKLLLGKGREIVFLSEEEKRRRLDQLSLDNIFTTGLPQEDAEIY